ncbi:GNAT family N-acetyltransferase [Lactococcus allomyrinae]|uniref:N-acetyltransferase family protein n=1 Tax=Lactococcus allomyrinae TaxID=2419773 RepID=A0A387BIG5_9LACT|nr:GNAT family N-acetyltransferase [Lactococcus allomyrinae]AYG00817.1 N-acetyltransferase family protein [Lactococcus allomyrinae]
MKFRLATTADATELLKIYKPYVEKTAITFEYEVPTVEDFAQRIEKTASVFPYLLAIENGKIIGYAYAGRYRERAAYDWVVELSIYLDENERHHGTGTILYEKLLTALSLLNYQRAYACITYPNPASMAFHEKFGFEAIGIFQKSGYKFGKWYGIQWMDLLLQKDEQVQPIKLITDLSSETIKKILE